MATWVLRGLGILILVLAGLGGGLLLWVDPNDFKPQIISAVRENTGRELRIDGDLGLEFLPYLAVSIGSVELGNSEGFDGPFLTLEGAHLKARLLPLLFSRLEVLAVDVDGLSLFLARDAEGRGNWVDLATPADDKAATPESPALARDRRVPVLASLIVDGLRVSEARVVWDDRLKGEKYDVSGIYLDISNFAFGVPFQVDTGASAKFAGMAGDLDFSTRAVLEFDRLILEDLDLNARISGGGLPETENIVLTASRVSTDGRVDNGRLQGLGIDVRFATREAQGALTAGTVEVAEFKPRDVFARLGQSLPDFSNPGALEKASFACNWSGTSDRLDISALRLALDDSTLQGDVAVLGRDNPFVSLDLAIDTLDINRYGVRSQDESGQAAEESSDDAITLPMRELRALNGNATLAVGSLAAGKIRCSDALLRMRAKGGVIDLDTLQATAYEGRLRGSGALDVRSDTPRYSWTHDVSGLQLGPLLADVHDQKAVEGTMRSTASVQTRGAAVSALKQNLGGNVDFKVTNGILNGVNIPKRIRDGIRALKGEAATPPEAEQTVFSELSGSGVIRQGLETTSDLLLLAPRFRVTGEGQADLVRESMDYRLVLHLEGSEGRFDEGALGISRIPVRVSGPFRGPKVAPDMEAVLRGLGLQGGKALEETIKGVGSGLNKGVEGLKRLFQ
jgi:AsmA protein